MCTKLDGPQGLRCSDHALELQALENHWWPLRVRGVTSGPPGGLWDGRSLELSLGFPLPDEMDQTPPAHPEHLVSGIRTPPVRRNSKLATLGRIFKPWKWRKKKNEKLKQTTSGECREGRPGVLVTVLSRCHCGLPRLHREGQAVLQVSSTTGSSRSHLAGADQHLARW